MQQLYDARLAPDFGFFDHQMTDEMCLSRMLATLLDPQGSHAQGAVFLRLFLNTIRLEWPDEVCDLATIEVEFVFPGGRLDVFVRSGDYFIAIENKPWAGSPDGQIERYINFVDGLTTTPSAVVFLSPIGTEPPENSLSSKKVRLAVESRQLILVSYVSDIVEWLELCRRHCRADRVAVWIDEFRQMVEGLFIGAGAGPMDEHVINIATDSPKSVKTTMELIVLQDAIRKNLVKRLIEQIERLVSNKGWKIHVNGEPQDKEFSIQIIYSAQLPKFGVEFQRGGYFGLIYGLVRLYENVPPLGTLRNELLAALGKDGKESPWWMWYQNAEARNAMCPVESNWSRSVDPWVKIVDGSLAAALVKSAEQIYEVITCRS